MRQSSPRRHWQRERKLPSVFIDRSKPITKKEVHRLATTSSVEAVQQLSQFFVNDQEAMRRRRWRELRNLWEKLRHSRGSLGCAENAFWFEGTFHVEADHFVAAMVQAFRFEDPSLRMDTHLRCLYWTFEEGPLNLVDWRDISASLAILIHYVLVKSNPTRLLLRLIDVYATEQLLTDGRQLSSETFIRSQHLLKVFLLPAIEEYDVNMIQEHFKGMIRDLLGFIPTDSVPHFIPRSHLEMYIHPTNSDEKTIKMNFLSKWQALLWDRLPTELRLHILDQEQLQAMRRSDFIAQNALLNRALKFRHIVLLKFCIAEWRLLIANHGTIIAFHRKRRLKRRREFFLFWFYEYTVPKVNRRKKNQLASIIGRHSTKSRCFHRIRLFISNNHRIHRVVGKYEPRVKRIAEGFGRLRRFHRLNHIRIQFHRWWEVCRDMINTEIAISHDERRHKSRHLWAWAETAHELAIARRMNAVALENQTALARDMEETEAAAQQLVQIEIDRRREYEEEKARRLREEEEERRRAKEEVLRLEKERENELVLQMQREDRQKRISKDFRDMKARHREKWLHLRQQYIAKEVNEAEKYLSDKGNAAEIQMRFKQTKKDFYAPPNYEYEDREKIIRSFKYIAMIYFYWKMTTLDMSVHDMLKLFDKEKKGYLSQEQMHELLSSLEIPGLSSLQLQDVVNEVNQNKDEFITIEKIERNLDQVHTFGVPGSVWKFYVDPVQNVMVYRNFETKEMIMEHFMTDKVLHLINVANIKGEAVDRALKRVVEERTRDWNFMTQSYMARRIQYMFRAWKGRRARRDMLWKVDSRGLFASRARERLALSLMQRLVAGMVARLRFHRQLVLTIEKVWDISSGLAFYHNHQTGSSSWEPPLLLRRYGDVEDPLPWVILHPDGTEQTSTDYTSISAFYNVPAGKHIPRKPDGWRVCSCFGSRPECSFFATRHCLVCDAIYCFPCHRHLHSNPFGFFQNVKPTPFQRLDPEFMALVARAGVFHAWVRVLTPVPCDICCANEAQGSQRLAAFVYCTECDKRYCRICNRRIHSHGKLQHHSLSSID